MNRISPTPYTDINTVLAALLAGLESVLGTRLVGLYLHGSLAGGDFEPGRSDIDFLAVTDEALPESLLPPLAAMHARLTASGLPWADRLEGSYIPLQALRRYDPADSQHPALRVDGSFAVDGHGSDWVIQRHLLRQKALALVGPPIDALIDPVSQDDLRRAARGILEEWWAPQLEDAHRLYSSEYQAYAILTMCRSFYTLQHGAVVSKMEAARWAQAALGKPWAALIEQALAWRRGMELDQLQATLDFIRYTLAWARQST